MNEKKPTYRVEIKNSGTPPNEAYGWKIYRNHDALSTLRSQQLFITRMAGLADASRSRRQLVDADTLGWPPQSN
jgi:LPS sulfotransferase NodH